MASKKMSRMLEAVQLAVSGDAAGLEALLQGGGVRDADTVEETGEGLLHAACRGGSKVSVANSCGLIFGFDAL